MFVELLGVLPCACVARTNVLPSPEPPQTLSFATSIVENQTTRLYAPHIARKDQQVFSAMCPAGVGMVAEWLCCSRRSTDAQVRVGDGGVSFACKPEAVDSTGTRTSAECVSEGGRVGPVSTEAGTVCLFADLTPGDLNGSDDGRLGLLLLFTAKWPGGNPVQRSFELAQTRGGSGMAWDFRWNGQTEAAVAQS